MTTRYLHDDAVDALFARIDQSGGTGTGYYYLTDRLGSIREVAAAASGTVLDAISYDGFGKIASETNSSYRGRYAWTGRELDTEIDLQYNRARYYDASTGRWISQDPLGFDAGDGNLYRYVNNSPMAFADPSGLQSPRPITLNGDPSPYDPPPPSIWDPPIQPPSRPPWDHIYDRRGRIRDHHIQLGPTREWETAVEDSETSLFLLFDVITAIETGGVLCGALARSTLRFRAAIRVPGVRTRLIRHNGPFEIPEILRPLPRDINDRIIHLYPGDNLFPTVPRVDLPGTHTMTGDILVWGPQWDLLTDGQRARIFFEELYHQKGILNTPIALRPLRAGFQHCVDAARWEEEFRAAWFATGNFREAWRYARSYRGISQGYSAGQFVFLVTADGYLIYYDGNLLRDAIRGRR